VFLVFNECKGRAINKRQCSEAAEFQEPLEVQTKLEKNKLINKIITLFSKNQNYMLLANNSSAMQGNSLQGGSSDSNPYLRQLIMKTREYEIRVRCRMLTGVSYLMTYIPQYLPELYELLTQQIFIILENANEFDMNLESFLNIKALLALPLSHHLRVSIIKKWVEILNELISSYKK
jgi:hypothetical protein